MSKGLLVIGTAHKVGSTWLYRMLLETGEYGVFSVSDEVKKLHPGVLPVDITLSDILLGFKGTDRKLIHKSHSLPPSLADVESTARAQYITMIRDPRDVIVSLSFYIYNLPVEMGGAGDSFNSLDDKGRILELIHHADFILDGLWKWNSCPFAYKVRYESFLLDSRKELRKIFAFLGLHLTESRVNEICEKHSFFRKSGRLPGDESRSDFLRKGVAGDWKLYFDSEVKSAFKTAKSGAWNDLLVGLGYENSSSW